jgi:hypothetical protein
VDEFNPGVIRQLEIIYAVLQSRLSEIAFSGHCTRQAVHEMHSLSRTGLDRSSMSSKTFLGHTCMHLPHRVHSAGSTVMPGFL